MSKHLHRDYHTSFCGEDASHILMTYEPEEADCAACLKEAKAQAKKAAADAKAAAAKAEKLVAAAAAEHKQRKAAHKANFDLAQKALADQMAMVAAAAGRRRHLAK